MPPQDDYGLLYEHEVPDRPDDFVCRGSRWRAGVAAIVTGTLAAALLLGPSLSPVHIWGWHGIEAIAYPAGLFMLLLTWFAGNAWRAHRLPTNWLLRAGVDGLYLRYRSPLNGDFPGEPVAVFLPRRLIRHIAMAAGELENRNADERNAPALDIHLRTADLGPLRQALQHERNRRLPARIGRKSIFLHFPVRVIADDAIRIDWQTPQFAVTPRLTIAADVLSGQYLRLVPAGARETLAANENRAESSERGLASTDAKAFVDGLPG